jgi:hypothetical protein
VLPRGHHLLALDDGNYPAHGVDLDGHGEVPVPDASKLLTQLLGFGAEKHDDAFAWTRSSTSSSP